MKALSVIIALSLLTAPLAAQGSAAGANPTKAKTPYKLSIPNLNSAKMSPDETKLAAVTCTSQRTNQKWVSSHSYELQVWDFHRGSILLRKGLGERKTEAACHTFVRYTGDDKLLAVYIGGDDILVLRADDLQLLRTIHVELPPTPSLTKHEIAIDFDDLQTRVTSFEVSPKEHVVALQLYRGTRSKKVALFVWKTVCLGGFISIYDLDSGSKIDQWEIGQGFLDDKNGISWRADGRQLAAVASDNMPCANGGATIYVFDPASPTSLRQFRVPNPVGDIAYGDGDYIYAANASCAGIFANKRPALRVYSAATGGQIGEVTSETGIRGKAAVSADRRRLIAYVGREKESFDWTGESYLNEIDSRFEVWDLATNRAIFSSPDLGPHFAPAGVGIQLSLSAHGNFAVATDFLRGSVQIFPM